METIEQLTIDLVEVKNNLKKGHIELDRAKEINNTAGKILGTIKVQLAQLALQEAFESRGRTMPTISYLETQKCLTE